MSTKIEWTDETWNPITGCAHVSPGCDNCYAAREAAGRLSHHPAYNGLAVRPDGGAARFTGEVRLHPDRLDQPLRWRKPRRVFVNSMSDLFHPDVPDEFICQVWAIMRKAEQHTFQILTKRPQRMSEVLGRLAWRSPTTEEYREEGVRGQVAYLTDDAEWNQQHHGGPYVLPNVWLGTSIESDRYAFRADHLRRTPAAVRFISAEPLLGPLPSLDLTGIDWVIVGGESGPGARPMHPDWVRDLRDRCTTFRAARDYEHRGCSLPFWHQGRCDHVAPAFFFKQAGGVLAREWGCKHRAGGDIDEWPEEFQIRKWPS